MKSRRFRYGLCTILLCGMLSWEGAIEAQAACGSISGPGFHLGHYIAAIHQGSHPVYASMDSDDVLKEASEGEKYAILADEGSGWMEIRVGDQVGYLSVEEEGVSVQENKDHESGGGDAEAVEAQRQKDISDSRRQALVEFALQFVGGRYRAGGNDPHSGVDCSGFTRYVLLHGADVSLSRSSGAQAQQGTDVSPEQMRPGDLIFYGKGGRINHVALYIGNGQVVHASTEKTGIKTSPWNYRTPARIKNVLGD